mmetsp:Transcript_16605/g.31114  ORF Transcript_16605/g.31114 Transcript_16605/m.31114 type:complete len:651 (+) Transcript_16605:348-2300(+)
MLYICEFIECCYSFLFTLHWGKDFSPVSKCVVFFLVLPVGQFVPFLAWIESFEFQCVDRCFEWFNLHTKSKRDDADMRAFEEAGGDLLYEYIQRKFYSHAGFLVEALAEAIPQSILQTIAVLYFGEATPLFIISIFVSICVISSKGYLISYSMHRPTFVFNFICIFADVLCMFATICWLFNYDDDGDDGDSSSSPLFDIHDGIKATWMCLFCGAAALLVISSGCFVLFVTMDKHHEIDIGTRYIHTYDNALVMYIEVHLAHFLCWFFSLVPMVVSLLTFKFIFFPIGNQNQDQCNDFAKYKKFYTALHDFVSTNKSDLKLHVTNRFLLHCKGNQHLLQSAVNSQYTQAGKKKAVREWLDNIDINGSNNYSIKRRFNEKTSELFTALDSTDPTVARSTVRSYNTASEFTMFTGKSFTEELATEFKLFETFFKGRPAEQVQVPSYKQPFATMRYFIALFAAAIGMPAFFLFVPTAVVFLIYSWCYPLIELVRAFAIRNSFDITDIAPLPLYLTLAYTGTLVLLICLAPTIHTFNRMCTDIVALGQGGLPPAYFDVMVVKKIATIHRAEINWHVLDRAFDAMFGMDVTLIIKSFCDSKTLNMEGLYGSRNLRKLNMQAILYVPPKPSLTENTENSDGHSIIPNPNDLYADLVV